MTHKKKEMYKNQPFFTCLDGDIVEDKAEVNSSARKLVFDENASVPMDGPSTPPNVASKSGHLETPVGASLSPGETGGNETDEEKLKDSAAAAPRSG